MTRHTLPMTGVGVALALCATGPAHAQADSTRRVPVRKERPAPAPAVPAPAPERPAPAPATLAPVPRDTAPAPVSTQRAPLARPAPRAVRSPLGRSGLSIGVAGGMTIPAGSYRDLGYDPGANITVPIGWHPIGRPLGLRATLAFDRPEIDATRNARTSRSGARPRTWSATLDGVLRTPIPWSRRDGYGLAAYGLAGGGVFHFRGLGGSNLAEAISGAAGERRVTRWGVGAGGGVEWELGSTAFFVESRWIRVAAGSTRAGNDDLQWVPVIVGLRVR